jgi:hypothetical protein
LDSAADPPTFGTLDLAASDDDKAEISACWTVAELLSPRFGAGPGPARLVEAHVSTLFFLGDRVFKLKKAVSLGFLDLSTRQAREAACYREAQLNPQCTRGGFPLFAGHGQHGPIVPFSRLFPFVSFSPTARW